MVENVFNGGATGVTYEMAHGGDAENATVAGGGLDHFVRFAARHARRQRAAVGMRDENRLFRGGNHVQAGALPAMRYVDRHPDAFIRSTTSAPNALSPLSWLTLQPLPSRFTELYVS